MGKVNAEVRASDVGERSKTAVVGEAKSSASHRALMVGAINVRRVLGNGKRHRKCGELVYL